MRGIRFEPMTLELTMASTVSDATRNDTWEMILDLERQVRYYGKLAGNYSMKYRTIRYFLLFGVLAEGAAVYFLSGQDPLLLWGTAGLGAFTLGFITVFDAVTNYAETAAYLKAAHLLCDELKTEAERLWRDIESDRVQDEEADERYTGIMDHWLIATRLTTLEVHDHDNMRATREAYEIVTSRYAR